MGKYVTNLAYRNYDSGIPGLASLSDITLMNAINNAEALVDAYMGFDLKLGGFEPHAVSIQHQWDIKTLKTFTMFPVPVRGVLRYRIQVSMLTGTGAGFYANINTTDVAVNLMGQYLEIVPLQAITYSLIPVLVDLGLNPPIVQADYSVGFDLATFGEQMYSSDGLTYYASNGFWAATYPIISILQPATLPPVPPVIYVDGVMQMSGFTINYNEGSVTFGNSQTGHTVTADYTAQIPKNVRTAAMVQTTALLTERYLKTIGMVGLDELKQGKRSTKRSPILPDIGLAAEAKECLKRYKAIAIA